MERGIGVRVAVAGPVALVAALAGMAVATALSTMAQWPAYVVAVLLPVAIGVWLNAGRRVGVRLALAVGSAVTSLGIAAVVALLALPVFEVAGIGMSGTGVHALLWGPVAVVLLGSLAARARSGAPLAGIWLVWWALAVAAIVRAEPLVYALTDLAGADAMAGSVAVLVTPTLGMSAWLGAAIVGLLSMRFAPGRLTTASAPTDRGGEAT